MPTTTTLTFSGVTTTEILSGTAYDITASAGGAGSPNTDVTLEFTAHRVALDVTEQAGFSSTAVTLDFTGQKVFLTDSIVNGAPIENQLAVQNVNNFDWLTADTFQLQDAHVNLKGKTFDNAGTVDVTITSAMVVDADVKGSGMFFIQGGSALTLDESVGRHQTIDMATGSTLNINAPNAFSGNIDVVGSDFTVFLANVIATSYSYHNDVLTLFANNQVIDRLYFKDSGSFGVFQPSVAWLLPESLTHDRCVLPPCRERSHCPCDDGRLKGRP